MLRLLAAVVSLWAGAFAASEREDDSRFQGQAHNDPPVLTELLNGWKRNLPLRLVCTVTTEFDKTVRARIEEEFYAANPGAVSPFSSLKITYVVEWIHDGKHFLTRERNTFPKTLADRRPAIDGKWHRQHLYDGKRCVGMESQGNREVPVIASAVPSDSVHFASAVATAARQGADLLLCASDGRGWFDFLATRKPRIGTEVVDGKRFVTVSWEEEWGESVVRTLYVDPVDFLVHGKVDRRPDGEVIREVDVAYRTAGDLHQPWRARIVTYTSSRTYGAHVPQNTTHISVDQFEVLGHLSADVFSFNPRQLPQGSEVLDIGRLTAMYVGAEISDADIVLMARAARDYLKGDRSFAQLTSTLPRQKNVAYPYLCGPHSLLALCEIHGVRSSTLELATLAETDDKGVTTIAGMLKALSAKGLTAKAFEMDLRRLREANLPAIVHIEPEHFSLLLKFDRNIVMLLDPPCRIVLMPVEDFAKVWSRKCIVLARPEVRK